MVDARASDESATPPARVGVLGGGRMGAGIAHAFAAAGSSVIVVERDAASAEAADARVREIARKAAERGTAGPLEQIIGATTFTSEFSALEGCDLVVEALPEDRALKIGALLRAETVIGPIGVLATNTSSISIDDLAVTLKRPERFLGLHFFNPVPASQLVEVVIGTATAPELQDRAREWVALLGKTPIVVRDAPGFASSRLGVALALEAIRMVEDGVATAESIDAAMELGYRHPMGPLRTTDVVGLDVRLAIAEELERKLGGRFTPPELLRRMVADGHLGRKSGRGFYEWGGDGTS